MPHPLLLLLVQIVIVLVAAQLAALAMRRFGQPAVIGEILAGILLGPSLLGAVAPGAMAALFPPDSLPLLGLVSQAGVLLFMLAVGLEVDLAEQRSRLRTALAISAAGIGLPFSLGAGFALVSHGALAPAGTSPATFALFIGIALSVTAFPVLARILQERGLLRTELGQTAIACAALSDLLAWSLLAGVVAMVDVHGLAVFGAFLAGVLVPAQATTRRRVHDRVLRLSSLVLLPLFFAQVGLRTRIGLLDTPLDWLLCGAIIAFAVIGKLGGVMLAARWRGMAWRESFALGALMNTRGLMELVVLNIGYELGILSPQVFTMFVIMALVTTLMTGPLVKRALKMGSESADERDSDPPIVG